MGTSVTLGKATNVQYNESKNPIKQRALRKLKGLAEVETFTGDWSSGDKSYWRVFFSDIKREVSWEILSFFPFPQQSH